MNNRYLYYFDFVHSLSHENWLRWLFKFTAFISWFYFSVMFNLFSEKPWILREVQVPRNGNSDETIRWHVKF